MIVAYDITNGETFSHVPQWVDDVKRYAGECDRIVTWETKLWEVGEWHSYCLFGSHQKHIHCGYFNSTMQSSSGHDQCSFTDMLPFHDTVGVPQESVAMNGYGEICCLKFNVMF